jgi:hypothetical protein
MRLLLDENLPRRLKDDFHGHEVFTVRDMGWNGIKNGELLRLMLAKGFDALLTSTKICNTSRTFQSIPLRFLY